MVRGLVRVCVYISPEAGGLDVGPDGMDGGDGWGARQQLPWDTTIILSH
jgi:hypothetical protein